jgi:hypothetical protein
VPYILHDLLEATYGFVLTISPRRSAPHYGKGTEERLLFQQDFRLAEKPLTLHSKGMISNELLVGFGFFCGWPGANSSIN